jgi:hypothetical protein
MSDTPVVPVTESTPTPAPAVKPGWQCTEFYLHLAATILGAVAAAGILPQSSHLLQVSGLVLTALNACGYTAARTIIKEV